MQTNRLWLWAFSGCYAVAAALYCATVLTPPAYGDLTRLGRLSEHAFGWHATQPAIDPALLRSWPLNEADVVVIGDSFSVAVGRYGGDVQLVWQSALGQAGHRVTTLHFDDVGPLCPDLPLWLAAQGFRGRWVLIESVERNLSELMRRASACTAMKTKSTGMAYTRPSPRIAAPERTLNWLAPITTGAVTAWNTARALHAESVLVTGPAEAVRIQRVEGGCKLFSHEACDRALFLEHDSTSAAFALESVQRLQQFNAARSDLQIVWVIVPNKSTVYLSSSGSADVARILARGGLGPDLFGALAAQRKQQVDLYAPNDTHLSTAGSLFMGQQIAVWLTQRDVEEASAKRTPSPGSALNPKNRL